jgi:hypothetical protein
MKKHYEKRIVIPIYERKLILMFSEDTEKLRSLDLLKEHDEIFAHTVVQQEPLLLIINFWNTQKISHGIIAHECMHITEGVFEIIGQPLTYHDEPRHYLLSWITNEVYKFIDKCGIKV